jgi:hypothetical protein
MQVSFNEVALDLVTRHGERLPVLVNAIERRTSAGEVTFTRTAVAIVDFQRSALEGLFSGGHLLTLAQGSFRSDLFTDRRASKACYARSVGRNYRSEQCAICFLSQRCLHATSGAQGAEDQRIRICCPHLRV